MVTIGIPMKHWDYHPGVSWDTPTIKWCRSSQRQYHGLWGDQAILQGYHDISWSIDWLNRKNMEHRNRISSMDCPPHETKSWGFNGPNGPWNQSTKLK